MSTIFLRFPDEATFKLLLPADFEQHGETGFPLPEGISAISIVGLIYKDETPVPGWHVNALGVLPASWRQHEVTPVTPNRVFGKEPG